MSYRQLQPHETERVVELLAEGRSYQEVGDELVRDRQTIANWARRNGLRSTARSGRKTRVDAAEVKRLRAQGMTWADVGYVLGYSRSHVCGVGRNQ